MVYVCHANLCRSPLAEHLTRAQLACLQVEPGITVASAGSAAGPGTAMDAVALQVLTGRGLDAAAFRTRRLDVELLQGAYLVLAASRRLRAAVAELDPRVAAHTFTTGELARHARLLDPAALPAGNPAERLRALVDHAAANRGSVPPASPGEDDVADPFRRGPAAMRECAALLAGQSEAWVDLLAPVAPTATPGSHQRLP